MCQQEVVIALGDIWKNDAGSKTSPVLKAWIGFVKLCVISKSYIKHLLFLEFTVFFDT
jgi:hypothetical protein